MKTMPLTAISSFSAMVERVRPGVLDQARGCSCHNGHRIARASGADAPRACEICPSASGCRSEVLHIRNQGAPLSLSRRLGQECSPSQWRFSPCTHDASEVAMASSGRGRTRAHTGPHRAEDAPIRPLVALPADHVRGVRVLHHLRDDPGVPGTATTTSAPYLSPFYSPCLGDCVEGSLRLRPAVRRVPALGGADHPDLPARLPADLLLLPQGLLPRLLALARRPAPSPSRTRRTPARPGAADPATTSTAGSGTPRSLVALILTYDTLLAFRDADGDWGHMGLGIADLPGQHRADLALHAVLPLVPPRRGWPAAALQQAPGPLPGSGRGSRS